jgi:hypothetical protein
MVTNRQTTFTLRQRFLVILLLISSILLCHYSYSQEPIKDASGTVYNKNAVKGIGLIIGEFVLKRMGFLSVGYERNISIQSIIELGGYYYKYIGDEHSPEEEGICIMPGYKYALSSPKKIFNNTWLSAYLVYFKDTYYPYPDPYASPEISIKYLNGIGCSVGRKMYFTKNKNWFFEIGIGASFNIFNIKPDSPHPCEPISVLPWPIFQIGGKF